MIASDPFRPNASVQELYIDKLVINEKTPK